MEYEVVKTGPHPFLPEWGREGQFVLLTAVVGGQSYLASIECGDDAQDYERRESAAREDLHKYIGRETAH